MSTYTGEYSVIGGKHTCVICGQVIGSKKRINQHLLKDHRDKKCVMKLKQHKGHTLKSLKLMLLWMLGDYKHNMQVLETGHGQLHISVSDLEQSGLQKKTCIPADYFICVFCFQFIRKDGMTCHYERNCSVKKYYAVLRMKRFLTFIAAESVYTFKGKCHPK